MKASHGPIFLHGCLTLVLLSCLVSPAVGRPQNTGVVTGRVSDATGALIPGVTVELEREEADHLETFTETDGSYRFDVSPGPAELVFRLINFSTVRRAIVVSSGTTTTEDVTLTVAASASITITAPATFRNLAELDNPAENIVGVAAASSEGAITAAQLQARPVERPAEVLETVPGLIISQHSGEGKANQYYLRGFNLDHGYDFAQTIAGLPVNFPSHAHAQGYADSNFLIPELVSGVQYRKGPYYAEQGDFSSAGAANINYFNQLERPILNVTGGSYDFGRVLGAASPRVGPGYLLAAFETSYSNGPWVVQDAFRKYNGVLRYSVGDSQNGFSITGMGYSARWNATEQTAKRAIDSGLIDRFGNLDPSDTGNSFRYSLIGDWQRSTGSESTRIIAYVQRYGVQLFHDFTYFLNDPVNGDQFEQYERRWMQGARITHGRLGHIGGYDTETEFGGEVRHDAVGGPLALYLTSNRQRLSTVRADDVDQWSGGVFGRTEIQWNRVVRTTFGLRADFYHYNVVSDNPLNSGTASTGVLSPKVASVFGPWNGTEFYVNAGLGFHSNGALGATVTVDPTTGSPVEKATPISRSRGAEFGVRTVAVPHLQTTATVWYLGFDSELIYVGDSGSTEAGPPSGRFGVEITNYAHPYPWITIDGDISFSRARYRDVAPGEEFVPGALNRVISIGFAVAPPEAGDPGPIGSLRLRHFGPRPLTEDNSVKSESTTLVNGTIGYRFSGRLQLVLEGFNLFDSVVSDIDYYYASRLPGEPPEGVDDIHLHPALPREARVSLQVGF
jgi:Carboxypeptidase regulatory-like domain/TonB dependent receptor-like, beta-barrel/TonB-dependent Receptor Plug Domain